MSERHQRVCVWANHWGVLDADGNPIQVICRDPQDGPGWIGSSLDPETGKQVFTNAPVHCLSTSTTRQRVLDGDLFPATPADAAVLKVRFVEPAEQLAKAKAAAVAAFNAQFGSGAWAALHEPQPAPVADTKAEEASNKSQSAKARK